ncbi:LysE family transporter [Ruminococcus sp. OA3]|uniref:LysE family translocator n=1 Tax=Ruminococcus sp. OA3 TaxID=2914164 RepID=UPI001F067322|nr:LysE family transporter [Ruminococcus sp. OA3]
MGSFILKGILIGLLFGVPAGAVGAMTAQRTLNYGVKAGLLTGLGSSVADCLYACVGAFGLTLISDFLLKYQNIVNLAGGCLIVEMGIRMFRMKSSKAKDTQDYTEGIRMFASSFAVGITNPAAILTFLFAFSWFGIHGQRGLAEGIGLVCGVFIGTYIWWGTLTGAASMFRKKSKKDCLPVMNRVFGLILILFGAVILVRNFLN